MFDSVGQFLFPFCSSCSLFVSMIPFVLVAIFCLLPIVFFVVIDPLHRFFLCKCLLTLDSNPSWSCALFVYSAFVWLFLSSDDLLQ